MEAAASAASSRGPQSQDHPCGDHGRHQHTGSRRAPFLIIFAFLAAGVIDGVARQVLSLCCHPYARIAVSAGQPLEATGMHVLGGSNVQVLCTDEVYGVGTRRVLGCRRGTNSPCSWGGR